MLSLSTGTCQCYAVQPNEHLACIYFNYGSTGKDGAAVAFCDARLLAVLRQEQWNEKSMLGQEICVLVRNARSAAYRRALATVVLEQQKEDLEFL